MTQNPHGEGRGDRKKGGRGAGLGRRGGGLKWKSERQTKREKDGE